MQPLEFKNITIDELSLPMAGEAKIKVFLLRLDKIHHDISGNKWFKLKFYIDDVIAKRKSTVLTFGGAWSNHISALAETCRLCKLKSIGVIRGEEPRDYFIN